MIVHLFSLSLVIRLTIEQQRTYNFFMPDLPLSSPVSVRTLPNPSAVITRETHRFTARSFTRIHLSGGPFNVELVRQINVNDTSTSVDVETQSSIHKQLTIDIDVNHLLTIRMIERSETIDRANITLFIVYKQLNELSIDGHTHIRCVNRIETDTFRLYNRGQGSMKLKLNVNKFDAYLHSIGNVKFCGHVNDDATLRSLGVGDIDARNLHTKTIRVISSGIGNIYIMATDQIHITLSGIGTVYYRGPLKQQITTGLGTIKQMEDISFVNDQ
jgi:hypothetical protein